MDRRIWLLSGAQFAAATGAYAFTGLLASLAADLGVSVAAAGQLVARAARAEATAAGVARAVETAPPAAPVDAETKPPVTATSGKSAARLPRRSAPGSVPPDVLDER